MTKETTATILVVDDDPTMRDVLEMRLQGWGFTVLLACDAAEAVRLVSEQKPDLVLSDIVMPDVSGLELLRQLKESGPDRPVVLLTAHGTVELAVEAMKEGALDFLTKPLNYANLQTVLEKALRDCEILAHSRRMISRLDHDGGFGSFIGTSPEMQAVYDLIREVADSEASVLITGESGTGKELAARTIHAQSSRRDGPFIPLNAAAIPRELVESELFGHDRGAFTGASRERMGCFELADGGTLFLDEIGEMPSELQPKLLRVLDAAEFRRVGGKREISVDVRTLSATNQDPREAVLSGTLREDLYYRLNVVTLRLPPLRERGEDVGLLAHFFLEAFRRKHGARARAIRDDTMALMERYAWPGNVRELKNVMERAVILGKDEWIDPQHLPPYMREVAPDSRADDSAFFSGLTAAEVEKRLILKTLDETGDNKTETARRLDLNVKTIRNKLKSWGIDR